MNVELCIALHNEILRYGWVGSGRSLESLEPTCKTWFDTYGDKAESVHSDFAPDLVEFLQHARVVQDTDPGVGWNLFFFYWVQNLAHPEFMFEQADLFNDQGENGRFLVLYAMSNFHGHICGLVYDQTKHLCMISPTIDETDEIFRQKVWYPLETVLEFWLGQIRKGRIATLPEDKDRNYHNDRFDPWEFVPYNDVMVEENIDAFNCLVEAIEARIPPTANSTEAEEVVHPLVDESVLRTIGLPQRFAYEFLRRARCPRFRMIAPGLEVLPTPTFSDQPFRSYLSSHASEIPPILLFRSKSNYTDKTIKDYRTGEPRGCLFPHNGRITTYPAGLYLHRTSMMKAEDECRFILPFGIGANGYARRSDGSMFGDRDERQDSYVDLYHPGHQPFEEIHEQSLIDVLKSWRGMVERGDWQVDGNGVAGDMDVWKEADSKEKWEKYVIPRPVGGVER